MSTVSEPKKKFSEYSKETDDFFINKPIEVKLIPDEFLPELEKTKSKKISSAKAFIDLIETEIDFWNKNDPNGKLKDFSKINKLKIAKENFETSQRYVTSNNTSEIHRYLNISVSNILPGILYSKTSLAKYIITFKDKNSDFLEGFRAGILKAKNSRLSNTVESYEGLIIAFNYRKVIDSYANPIQDDIDKYNAEVNMAIDNLSRLNSSYVAAFHEQEERINQINNQANDHFQNLNEKTNIYFSEKEKRCAELENLYQEKLKLQKPAKYWEEMEKEYNKKGTIWMIVSAIWAVAIVGTLILTIIFLPNLFSENSHWIDIFKNSAIITVITSVAVYVLRIFVKLAISSYHLERDAKERNKLTYFYLALIEKDAVSNTECAIVLNSLFSRADTGLLKGDSSPSMSANISDLVQTLSKN